MRVRSHSYRANRVQIPAIVLSLSSSGSGHGSAMARNGGSNPSRGMFEIKTFTQAG